MNYLEITKEYASIRRGENPAWEGDRILNSEVFLIRLMADFPDDAQGLANDIQRNIAAYQENTGLSERGLLTAVLTLKGIF